MQTRLPARSIASALLLWASSACDQAPLVDKRPYVPPSEQHALCSGQSVACTMPDTLINSLSGPRALRLFPCVPSEQDLSLVEQEGGTHCPVPDEGVAWRDRAVLIASREPREVVVSDVEVVQAQVRLAGPITLRFLNVPRLEHVEIESASPEALVVFEHAVADHVTIGDATHPFAGQVEAHHTRFDGLSMNAASFEIDSGVIAGSFVSARRLDSGDGAFSDVVIDVGDGLFAPSELRGVRIVACETLAFFGSTLRSSMIPRCTGEATRVYDIDAEAIVLDGVVQGAGGMIRSSLFGRDDPSEYVLWGVLVSGGSTFCNNARALQAAGGIRCSYCEDGAFGSTTPCNLLEPDAEPADARRNPCAALDLTTQCSAPLPERLRPQRE